MCCPINGVLPSCACGEFPDVAQSQQKLGASLKSSPPERGGRADQKTDDAKGCRHQSLHRHHPAHPPGTCRECQTWRGRHGEVVKGTNSRAAVAPCMLISRAESSRTSAYPRTLPGCRKPCSVQHKVWKCPGENSSGGCWKSLESIFILAPLPEISEAGCFTWCSVKSGLMEEAKEIFGV